MSSPLTIPEEATTTTAGDPTPGPSQFHLRRTGNQPLEFEGTLIAQAAGPQINGRQRDRGHDIRVYRTVGGTYVVETVYWTTWAGEAEVRTATPVGREASAVAAALRAHNPLDHVMGYPPAERFRSKQERLFVRLREDFATRVTDVLSALPDAVERIR